MRQPWRWVTKYPHLDAQPFTRNYGSLTLSAFTGKILFVDLSQGTCTEETIPEEVYGDYLSGIGLAAYVLFAKIPRGADPLGPDNVLGFVAGLLTGTGALYAGRWMAVAKSPLTGTWGDANCGGNLAPAIKRCGYDGLFFRGAAENPVYLYADGATIEVRDASHIWGMDTVETELALAQEPGIKRTPAIASIGPAGENLSLISGIANDKGRIAARSGLGAVMGSKRLKAIVLTGSKRVDCADRAAVKALNAAYLDAMPTSDSFPVPGRMLPLMGSLVGRSPVATRTDGKTFWLTSKKWGTIVGNQLSVAMGDAPVKNWKGSSKDFPSKLSQSLNPDHIIEKEKRNYHCYACPLGCGGIVALDGPYEETHKPEYETVTGLGALLLNNDLDSICYLNELLNRAGMDSISAGGVVAFAIECFEQGILTTKDTDGLSLTWGNVDAITTLIEKMIAREGIGDLLADGVVVAAEQIGKGSDQFAVHAGGQELPMHDPRLDPVYGLHYSVEPTPGRHTIGATMYYDLFRLWEKSEQAPTVGRLYSRASRHQPNTENGRMAALISMLKMVIDGAGLCLFGAQTGIDRLQVFEYLNAVTGWQKTADEYLEIGRRIQTLRQLFNIREGIDPRSLKISPRALGAPPLKEGPLKGKTFDLDALMQHYWHAMGWDGQTGIPLNETVEQMGLCEIADEFTSGEVS